MENKSMVKKTRNGYEPDLEIENKEESDEEWKTKQKVEMKPQGLIQRQMIQSKMKYIKMKQPVMKEKVK